MSNLRARFQIGRVNALLLLLVAMGCSESAVNAPQADVRPVTAAVAVPAGSVVWLPGLGTGVADAATFDAAGVTRVEVCAWASGACVGANVAQFAITPTGADEQLTANTAAGRYEATFNLLNTKFLTRKTYRVRALKGATEVGGINVDIVRGRWALSNADGSLAPLVAANTLPIQFYVGVVTPPTIKINEVESNGGTPGDWAELLNTGTAPVDISGFVFKDNDDTHNYTIPAGTVIAGGAYYVLEEAAFGFGLGAPDATRLFDKNGTLVDSYNWTAHAATTYGRCPNGSGAFITMTTTTKGAVNDCSVPNFININEVESNGGVPGDWVELYNFGTSTVDLSGYSFKDNDDTHNYVLPAGSTIGAGGYFMLEEAAFGFGLGAADAARLYDKTGALVASYTWTTHATTTYGRCVNGTGAFTTTNSSTKGTANDCGTVVAPPTNETWPGTDNVVTADGLNVFGGNLSGLVYEAGTTDVLWGARNGPGSIFRLVFNGTIWTPDPSNGWSAGKQLRYTDGNGEPDTEDITYTTGSSAGMYIVSERNNSANSVSRPSILRYDVSGTSSTPLVATNEWNLTADLPVVAANSGLEAITWIPDSALVAQKFLDVTAGHLYNPSEYANHGTGLFFVGLEGNGFVYVYALNHVTNAFTKLASFSTGFPAGVMSLQYDRELGQLWAGCDDTCGGLFNIYVTDQTVASPTLGRMKLTHIFNRPSTMPNINNEGFGFAPQSRCVNGFKPAFWSDDSETGGHAIRTASIPCVKFP